jgi:hypothetical protein
MEVKEMLIFKEAASLRRCKRIAGFQHSRGGLAPCDQNLGKSDGFIKLRWLRIILSPALPVLLVVNSSPMPFFFLQIRWHKPRDQPRLLPLFYLACQKNRRFLNLSESLMFLMGRNEAFCFLRWVAQSLFNIYTDLLHRSA